MNIDDDAKIYIYWDAVLTFNPATSTVELEVGATKYPMTWQGSAVAVGATWTQTARTDSMFRGTAASTTGSPIALTAGRHMAQPLVTIGSQVVPCAPAIPIDVE